MLHASVYKYIMVHCQANEFNELREKFCHRECNLETLALEIYSRFSRSLTARGYLLGNPPGYKANKLGIIRTLFKCGKT